MRRDVMVMLISLAALLLTALALTFKPETVQSQTLSGGIQSTLWPDHLKGNTTYGGCPPCHIHFQKLKKMANKQRKPVQDVQVSLRGEPKSGTGFMLEWAGGALEHACTYLAETFGERSCKTHFETSLVFGAHSVKSTSLTFEPRTARLHGHPGCPCDDVEMVQVHVVKGFKHVMPVQTDCQWIHGDNIAPEKLPCTFRDKSEPTNYQELMECVEKSRCRITDHQQQMAVFRDPRPMAAHPENSRYRAGTVDEFVDRMLAIMCQWVAIRYNLFTERMKNQSDLFFYEDAFADPVRWHEQWYQSVGLNLPDFVVKAASDAAIRHEFSFPTKGGLDVHPGGHSSAPPANATRSYRDDLKTETVAKMDDVLRTWLPPELLEKFGVQQQ